MSEMNFWSGKIIPTGITEEDFAKTKGLEVSEFGGHRDYFPADVIVVNGYIYVLDEKDLDPCGDIIYTKNEDGSFDVTALYYDGGTCIEEIVEEIINKENK